MERRAQQQAAPQAQREWPGAADITENPERPSETHREVKFHFTRPVCGDGNADAAWRRDRWGEWQWFVSCFSASCDARGGGYLRELAEHVGAPDGFAIKNEPLPYLEPLIDGDPHATVSPAPAELPSDETVRRWEAELADYPRAMRWLRVRRGLSRTTVRRYRLGFDGRAIVIPVFDAGGVLVNVRRRFLRPGSGPKIVGLAGRGSHLYPAPPEKGSTFLLGEGELDALVTLQHGLPAVTGTAGTTWKDDWNRYLHGCRVAVVYDSSEASYELARQRAAAFREAGAREAWAVDLGLEDGEDLTDWFVTYGRTSGRLARLIRDQRKA